MKTEAGYKTTSMEDSIQNNHAQQARAVGIIKIALFSASLVPAVVAGSLAAADFGVSLIRFLLAGAGLLLGQMGGDYLYYYFSEFHTDPQDAHTKIFAGWHPLFAGTLLKPAWTLCAGAACLALDGLIGVYFFSLLGYPVLVFAAAGGLVALFFTPLMRRGYKEPVIFVCFGPLCVAGVYYALTGRWSLKPWIASLPVGFLVTAVAYLKSSRYRQEEQSGGILIFDVRPQKLALYFGAAYVSLVLAVVFGFLRPWTLLGLLSVPLAVHILRILKRPESHIVDYLRATIRTLALLTATGLLMAVGVLI